jgi:hypothetical protein
MAKKIEIELDVKSKKAQEQIENLNEELKDTNKNLDDVGKEGKKGVGKLSGAFKGLGTAIKGMGIGLVIAGFAALFAALKNNQKVMDGFNVVMGTISQVFTEVGNVLVTVYENVSSSTENFDALGKVLKGIITIAITPLKLGFQAIKGAIVGAQLAWEQSWLGGNDPERIAELKSELKDIGQGFVDIKDDVVQAGGDIVNNFSEAITEAGDIGSQVVEGLSEINIKAINDNIAANVQLKKDADRARVANQGLIEQYDRQAEQQRQIRDNDLKNIDDRVAANDKLKEILDDQKEKMLENADIMIKQAQAQFDLTGKEEDYLVLQEALNEEKAVEAQIEGFMSEQESNRVALLKEKIELELSNDEATTLRQNEERNFVAEMEQSEVTRIQTMIDNLEIERQIEEDRLLLKRDSYEAGTQAWQDANNELLDSMQASNQEQDKLDKDLGESKLALTKQTLGALATIVGKSSKFGKGIAIAQAIMDTYAGADKALSAAPPPYNFIQAAAVIATGLSNVKNILKTKPPAPPSGLGARGSGDVSVAIPTPPAFNIVGQGLSNQLADVISSQQPIQAFVVSNDVTTAQELDRNIITGASLG